MNQSREYLHATENEIVLEKLVTSVKYKEAKNKILYFQVIGYKSVEMRNYNLSDSVTRTRQNAFKLERQVSKKVR